MSEEILERETSGPSVLSPVGDLTIFEAAKFHEELTWLARQEGPLELNLSAVEQLDSSCVQLIVAATRTGRVRVAGYSQGLRDRFEQIGFAQFLPANR